MALNTGLFNIQPGESPKDVDMRRRLAAQLVLEGTSTEPIQAPTQGFARLAQALLGGLESNKLDAADARREAMLRQAFTNLPGMEGRPAATPASLPSSQPPMAAPQAPPMLNSPAPGGGPVMPPAPRAPIAQALEGTVPTDTPYEAGGMPRRPPQAAINSAINQTPGSPGGPQITPPPGRQAPKIPDQVQKQIQALWADPQTRPLALQLYQEYSTPKDQWETINGPNGPIAQRNLANGEIKQHPNAPDYNISQRSDGAIVSVNTKNPKDFNVISPPGAGASIAAQKGKEKSAEIVGGAQGTATTAIPSAENSLNIALKTIDQIEKHPGKQYGTGALGVVPGIPGTDQRGFVNLVNQAKGQVFLNAYETLKGAGQITEVEGAKAEGAIARLDRAQKPEDFQTALDDLKGALKSGLEKVKRQASGNFQSAPPASRPDPLGLR